MDTTKLSTKYYHDEITSALLISCLVVKYTLSPNYWLAAVYRADHSIDLLFEHKRNNGNVDTLYEWNYDSRTVNYISDNVNAKAIEIKNEIMFVIQTFRMPKIITMQEVYDCLKHIMFNKDYFI